MTKKEVDTKLRDFVNSLIREGQLTAFETELLRSIPERDLQSYARSQLNLIRSCFRYFGSKPKVPSTPTKKPPSKSSKNSTKNSRTFTITFKGPLNPLPLKYQGKTYKQMADEIGKSFSFVKQLISSKRPEVDIREDDVINNLGWSILADMVSSVYKSTNRINKGYPELKSGSVRPVSGGLPSLGKRR